MVFPSISWKQELTGLHGLATLGEVSHLNDVVLKVVLSEVIVADGVNGLNILGISDDSLGSDGAGGYVDLDLASIGSLVDELNLINDIFVLELEHTHDGGS